MKKRRERKNSKMPEYSVTGGTGFIASHLIKHLLAKGHTVRATVRDPSDEKKVGFLWGLDGAKDRLRVVKADLMVDGSFDDAVDGVDGIFHAACPTSNIREVMVDPAIKGTMNVLRSCSKSSSVKRVVLTSTCSAIRYVNPALISTLDESHWSDIEYCKKYNLWYAYAKTLAEKEAWRLAKELNINLVVVNPALTLGPTITPQPTSTPQMIFSIMKGHSSTYPNLTRGFVHIDDVVSAHMIAMEDARASGRLICSDAVAHWSEITDMLKSKFPSFPLPNQCDEREGDSIPHSMDTTKIKNLGLPAFKSINEMVDDCIKSFQEMGIL